MCALISMINSFVPRNLKHFSIRRRQKISKYVLLCLCNIHNISECLTHTDSYPLSYVIHNRRKLLNIERGADVSVSMLGDVTGM